MALYDTTKAVQTLNTALRKLTWRPSFWIPWSTLQLITGHPDTVLTSYIPPKLTNPLIAIRMADSYMMTNDSVQADHDLDSALVLSTGKMKDPRLLGRILFRKASRKNWGDYLKILNGSYAVADSSDFESLSPANKLFALSFMITKEKTKAVLKLGAGVIRYPFQKYYFETYLDLIDYLAVHGNISQAQNVTSFLKEQPSLRLRWKQMIGRKEQFLAFMNRHRNLDMLKYSRNRR
jgi:hypothetical protein